MTGPRNICAMDTPHEQQRPPPDEDTTAKRVKVRMARLGLTQTSLGASMERPMSQAQVNLYLGGQRPWRRPGGGPEDAIERFARALGVPVAALEPGGPWDVLVNTPSDSA